MKLRLSVVGLDQLILEKKLDNAIDELKALIPDQIYGYGNVTMEGIVGNLLKGESLQLLLLKAVQVDQLLKC